MAYVEYKNLKNPNEVLTAMFEFCQSKGYEIVENVKDDLNIFDRASSDGKKFVIKDKTGDYIISFRSANGKNIFGSSRDSNMDSMVAQTGEQYSGIGMTAGEGYSSVQRWYNQFNAPVKFESTNNKDVLGMWMPIPTEIPGMSEVSYTLFCNYVLLPVNTLVFSLMLENTDTPYRVVHMSFANLNKFEDWEGGLIMSASANRYMIDTAFMAFWADADADKNILPLYSSSEKESNTLLRISIDEAPSETRGNILWASSGKDIITGKPLSMPIRTSLDTNGKIPHYFYLQSRKYKDSGMNVNTLNCITINMPLYASVRVDPDVLDLYSAVGTVNGVFFISTLNVQTSHVYEMSYPRSGDTCQVFPMNRRRGKYGFDGISIKQVED